MDLITTQKYNHLQLTADKGSILSGDTHIIPVGKSPLPLESGINIVSGWPLRGIFPNRLYKTRVEIDATLLGQDLAISNGRIHMPGGVRWDDDMSRYHSVSATLHVSNLDVTWSMGIPECSVTLDDYQDDIRLDLLHQTSTSYYSADNGTDLTDPTTAQIMNHYIVKYAAMDRGYGRMKHGWFWADVSGTWSWSTDGTDVVEVVVDDGVVASKYTNSGTVGMGVLYGTIDLVAGWHHLFAYTSDRGDASKPDVWFKRPGDVDWTTLGTGSEDGLVWNRAYTKPQYVELQTNSGNITAAAHFDDTNKALITFNSSLLKTGGLSISIDTLPRYKPYYNNNWRESQLPPITEPSSMPPRFENMRAVVYYSPLSEMPFFPTTSPPQDFVPRFLVQPASGGSWYKWTGSAFQAVAAASVDNLMTNGNTLYEINHVPESDWSTFLGTDHCRLMFTGEPPLLLASNRKILGSLSEAEYMLGTKAHLSADIRVQKRTI